VYVREHHVAKDAHGVYRQCAAHCGAVHTTENGRCIKWSVHRGR
jgi:hypothetical protein